MKGAEMFTGRWSRRAPRRRPRPRARRPARDLAGAAPAAEGCSTVTCEPSVRREAPSTTTVSPGLRPLADDRDLRVLVPDRRPAGGSLCCWRATTYTYGPCGPRCTAAGGTTTAFCTVSTFSLTLTNPPGQSLWLGIRERGLQLDRAGGLVDLVVEHGQRAAVQYGAGRPSAPCASASTSGLPRLMAAATAGSACCGRVNTTEIGCRVVMTTRPVVSEVWTMFPASTCRMPGAPIDRGDDCGVAELCAGAVDLRLILLHLRLELRDRRLLRVRLLRGGVGGRRQLLVAREIDARIGEIGLVLRLLRDRLVERCLEGARVDPREHVARLYVLALAEKHLDQRARPRST